MSDPFLGEIKIISWNYPPKGWAFCSGQLLPINQNQALFSLLGTTYGGNGQTTFGLPDFRGRVPVHVGGGFTQGQSGGEEFHTLGSAEMPAHNHPVNGTTSPGTVNTASGNFLANSNVSPYRTTANTAFNAAMVSNAGGSQPHENRQPFLVLNFVVALQGIFPSRN
jgi:microcystin-dependent protein